MKRSWMIVLFGIAVVASMVPWELDADWGGCNSFPNSMIRYFPGYGNVCASPGPGCTECWTTDGGACVTDGDFCIPVGPLNDMP